MQHAKNLSGADMVVLTMEEYEALQASADDAADGAMIDAARATDTRAPTLPANLLLAVMEGEIHPIAAWAQAAGMTQAALAKAAGVRPATLSDIIHNRIDPRLSTLRAIAGALKVDLDDIAG